MKKIIIIGLLAVIEVFLCLLLVSPIFVNDRKCDRAFMTWRQNKTPKNETIWKQESARIQRQKLVIRFAIGGLLVANTIGLIWAARRIRKNAQQRAAAYGS